MKRQLIAVLVVLLALAGCSKRWTGENAMSVSSSGHPELVTASCSGSVSDVTVRALGVNDEVAQTVRYHHSGDGVGGVLRLDLVDPGKGWTRSAALTLNPLWKYTVWPATAKAGNKSSGYTLFQTSRLSAMKPGHVYHVAKLDSSGAALTYRSFTTSSFKRQYCD